MLTKLKSFLKDQKIDFFLQPNSDEFFLEYLPESEKRIQAVTAFNGSNATVIFGQEKSYFFTDGRYILQAKNQLDLNEFEIFNMAEKSVLAWLEENLTSEKKLAFDSKLISTSFFKSLERISKNLVLGKNPIDSLWKNRPLAKNSPIFFLDEKVIGKNSIEKRHQICASLKADALLITKPENICWLLNLRASDIEFTPFPAIYAILFKDGKMDLFANEKRISDLENINLQNVNLIEENCLDLRISFLGKSIKTIQIEERALNYWLYQLLEKNHFQIISQTDPIELPKSLKNSAEITGAIKAHEIDGLAVTKFLLWLQDCGEIDEIKAAEKLLQFRKESPNFLYESFAAISGFASNGAIIHYHSTPQTNKTFICNSELDVCHAEPVEASKNDQKNSLYLIDSGGQYFGTDFCGTTDITRTIAIGKPSAEMIENFTRVLKGHIAIARTKFPRGTTGAQLDVLARQHLWRANLDYDHGTGHGVGSFLSVHEGPCGISKRAHQPLLEGMILSNEPGFYKEGKYGIRVENLMLVEKFNEKFLQFRTLTLAPIDASLIDFKMLTYPEKKWLKEYHQNISQKLENFLNKNEKMRLQKLINSYEIF